MRGREERTRPVRRTADADEHRPGWLDRTPTDHVARFGRPDRIRRARSRRRLHRSRQHLLARSRQGDSGTDIADDTPVAPVNNWLHSLFSQVDVHLNDMLVTPSSNTYPFRAYGAGEGNGEVSATPGRLQGILDTTGHHVEHAREPVPRNATETHHPVVRRQRHAQRCVR